MPSPNSALSSNSELLHTGPRPSSFMAYGVVGRLAPKIDEHPVALATIIRSPNSWVTSLMYGVSPQPAQAPENSNSGCNAWDPFTESWGSASRSISGMVRKKSHDTRSTSR